MQPGKLLLTSIVLTVVSSLAAQTAAPAIPAVPSAPAKAPAPPPELPDLPSPLPGKGLAQHDFLFSGEYDTRFPVQTMYLVKGGKVVWTYEIPIKDQNNNLSEYSDMHMLSNGDIVFASKTGWRKINQAKETLYDFQCPKEVGPDGKEYWRECHTAQPIGQDRVMYMLNGAPAKLCIYNIKTGKLEMEHIMRTKNPADPKTVHGQFRNVRMTKAGTFLIAHMDLGKVIEYDRNWNEIWSCDAPSVWHATRLTNGNTLISGNQYAFAREISPKGEIVWEVKDGDLPGIKLLGVHQAIRLSNGNTIITNWCPGRLGRYKELWPKTAQLVELTPDKKVVWVLSQWKDPDLGTASCIQILGEPGKAEEQDLMR